ncbi:transcriptional regulator [Acrocarpospora phusangensis]|uniref:Transcriptional regulator n=2 Tax=Acrocarpospora phusangensis TaxID=1070424 RepID=A0A919QG85_9ACTN|nr:transcriptional regulator [Acrocarpospora phusangensis]
MLGEFLRARREVTSPAQVELLDVGLRRTPGLRREEVAMLAGVSTDYYIRLEQGRERHPSDQVIGALAEVFGLGPDATAYLYALAHSDLPPLPPAARPQVSPSLLRLMRSWDWTPAFVMNRTMEVLAINPLAAAFYGRGLPTELEPGDNMLRVLFLHPAAREFYRDWEVQARSRVAHLRATFAGDLDDPGLATLVEEMSDLSDDFRRVWARHDVGAERSHTKRFRHAYLGELTINCDMFSVSGAPGQQLVTLQPVPGSPSVSALAALRTEVREDDPSPGP